MKIDELISLKKGDYIYPGRRLISYDSNIINSLYSGTGISHDNKPNYERSYCYPYLVLKHESPFVLLRPLKGCSFPSDDFLLNLDDYEEWLKVDKSMIPDNFKLE